MYMDNSFRIALHDICNQDFGRLITVRVIFTMYYFSPSMLVFYIFPETFELVPFYIGPLQFEGEFGRNNQNRNFFVIPVI